MTVAELIAMLQGMPQDARVLIESPNADEVMSVNRVVIPVRSGPCAGGQELLVLLR